MTVITTFVTDTPLQECTRVRLERHDMHTLRTSRNNVNALWSLGVHADLQAGVQSTASLSVESMHHSMMAVLSQ
jgi:hypothetical protein